MASGESDSTVFLIKKAILQDKEWELVCQDLVSITNDWLARRCTIAFQQWKVSGFTDGDLFVQAQERLHNRLLTEPFDRNLQCAECDMRIRSFMQSSIRAARDELRQWKDRGEGGKADDGMSMLESVAFEGNGLADEEEPAESEELRRRRASLALCLAGLEGRQQQVYAYLLDGLRPSEIAATLEVTRHVVGMAKKRGRDNLLKCLREKGYPV